MVSNLCRITKNNAVYIYLISINFNASAMLVQTIGPTTCHWDSMNCLLGIYTLIYYTI